MKPYYVLPLLVLLFSCKNEKDEQLKRDIVGEWKFERLESAAIRDDLPPPVYGNNFGYEFKAGGIYEDKRGFGWVDTLQGYENRRWHDAGRISRYKIDKDSLRLFNPVYKVWTSVKIVSVTADTLVLQVSKDTQKKYSKLKYQNNPNEHFDQIIVSSSGCYGSCPIADISIKQNGNVVFQAFRYNTVEGFFTAGISRKEYDAIELDFKKSNIDSLKQGYYASHTDDEEVSVTFIKGDKIYKTVTDYGNEAPFPFILAYHNARYLYQHLDLKPQNIPLSLMSRWELTFRKNDLRCNLAKSESFYLYTELMKAKQTEQKFRPEYKARYWKEDKELQVITDGRYYKFPPEDGGKTLDLGYNFIERNGLEKRFIKVDDL